MTDVQNFAIAVSLSSLSFIPLNTRDRFSSGRSFSPLCRHVIIFSLSEWTFCPLTGNVSVFPSFSRDFYFTFQMTDLDMNSDLTLVYRLLVYLVSRLSECE